MVAATSAFDRGLRAYEQGLYRNPYAKNGPLHSQWNEGYNYGRISEEADRVTERRLLERIK